MAIMVQNAFNPSFATVDASLVRSMVVPSNPPIRCICIFLACHPQLKGIIQLDQFRLVVA
jgi:hypothetical protein